MISLIFDLDDTLYFQKDQFLKTVEQTGYLKELKQIEELYVFFQEASERTYKLQDDGQLTLEEMRILRVIEAYKQLGIQLDEEKALHWQESYEINQQNIQLNPSMKELLIYCYEQNVQLGIITNGPSKHQRMKIEALGLSQWFPEEHILVSGDMGISKPNKAIFTALEKKLMRQTKEYYYIGDNYDNDVVGALNMGWQPIWLNHKQEKRVLDASVIEVTSRNDLINKLKKIMNK